MGEPPNHESTNVRFYRVAFRMRRASSGRFSRFNGRHEIQKAAADSLIGRCSFFAMRPLCSCCSVSSGAALSFAQSGLAVALQFKSQKVQNLHMFL